MGWNYLSMPKLQLEVWEWTSNSMPHFYNGCNYLSMLGSRLIHASKRGPWGFKEPFGGSIHVSKRGHGDSKSPLEDLPMSVKGAPGDSKSPLEDLSMSAKGAPGDSMSPLEDLSMSVKGVHGDSKSLLEDLSMSVKGAPGVSRSPLEDLPVDIILTGTGKTGLLYWPHRKGYSLINYSLLIHKLSSKQNGPM